MRNRIVIVLAVAFAATAIFFSWGKVASAQSFNTGSNVTLSGTVDKTVFAGGQTVNINAEVNGDVFCAGQTVSISGKIHGDVICGGQTITINGVVDGDIRLAGQTVSVGATVDGNATIGAQTFTLDKSGRIAKDSTIGAQDASINGSIGRDVTVGGENVTFSGNVGRNVTTRTTYLTIAKTANITGNITYTSNNQLVRQNGSTVVGKTTRQTPPQSEPAAMRLTLFRFSLVWFLYMLLASIFSGIIVALLFPEALRSVSLQATTRPWQSLLVGFLSGFVAPALIVFLAATVIGIPLA